ncbi:MAG TPA: sulfur carrier protein ThiS [Spongiibacteraceae bacterium]|nr:sulfur carrier protein ThiS [Spongiibacteraceae bacterium]
MIEIVLNGEGCTLPPATSVASALQQWGYRCEQIAVAINGEFVARGEYSSTLLRAKDFVDVVAPVQGG